MSQIAIVEDDQDQCENLKDALVRRGFDVITFANRVEAFKHLSRQPPMLLISDIILEGEYDGGFELCKDLLALYPNLAVIFMTERVGEIDQVMGLTFGAIDYLPKPFSINVMIAKVVSHMKHLEAINTSNESDVVVTSGPLTIKEAYNEVIFHEQPVNMTSTELKILTRLVKAKGRILSKDQLSDETRNGVVDASTINTHIKNIRKKLRHIDASFEGIKSEYGVGFKWVL